MSGTSNGRKGRVEWYIPEKQRTGLLFKSIGVLVGNLKRKPPKP